MGRSYQHLGVQTGSPGLWLSTWSMTVIGTRVPVSSPVAGHVRHVGSAAALLVTATRYRCLSPGAVSPARPVPVK